MLLPTREGSITPRAKARYAKIEYSYSTRTHKLIKVLLVWLPLLALRGVPRLEDKNVAAAAAQKTLALSLGLVKLQSEFRKY